MKADNPFEGHALYVPPPRIEAKQQVAALHAEGALDDARLIEHLTSMPSAVWLGEWSGADPTDEVRMVLHSAAGQKVTFVLYFIPERDCGQYSAGGAASSEEYTRWVRAVAAALKGSIAAVVLEPDALAHSAEVDGASRDARLQVLSLACIDLVELVLKSLQGCPFGAEA